MKIFEFNLFPVIHTDAVKNTDNPFLHKNFDGQILLNKIKLKFLKTN